MINGYHKPVSEEFDDGERRRRFAKNIVEIGLVQLDSDIRKITDATIVDKRAKQGARSGGKRRSFEVQSRENQQNHQKPIHGVELTTQR